MAGLLGAWLVAGCSLTEFPPPAGDDVWIRFVGMLASIIGFYYVQVAGSGLDRFLPWSVVARYDASAFMVLLVVLRMIGPSLLLFAAIDAAGATWTWSALRSARRTAPIT